jgi:hypothetical protein
MPRGLTVNFCEKPRDWFLVRLAHVHTSVVFRGDKHEPVEWLCELQHTDGGRLQQARGPSANAAFQAAVKKARRADETEGT